MRLTSNFSFSIYRNRTLGFIGSLPLFFFFLISCGQQDDQREFERQAHSPPENFTETQDGNEIINEDPDDWRIAPFFEGQLEVAPAWPNPVQSTDAVHFQVDLSYGIESLRLLRLRVYHYDLQNPFRHLREEELGINSSILIDLQFTASELSLFNTPGEREGLYRVILFDERDNVITYGDIQVN